MALMWPRRLPPEITSDILRSTECKVYLKLQKVLKDSFTVFYSRPWLGLTYLGEEKDGECDFVVAHPDKGILAIEVKGGAIAYDPNKELWTSRDRFGIVHRIKNPVKQARSSKYQILKKLQASDDWKPRRIPFRHCVILPDSERPIKDMGADMPLSIFCFHDDFENNLQGWINARMGDVLPQEYPLGEDGMMAIEGLLAHPFKLHVPIGNILADDDTRIETLTHQQFHILTAIQDIPRAAISGGAGTGKTVLAMEEAIRRADAGMRVLLTCYNKPLAVELQDKLHNWRGITVATFHELCARFAVKSGIVIPNSSPYDYLFTKKYPEILVEAIKVLPNHRFDVIIVDEGQDFMPYWLSALGIALNSGGFFRIFYDSNQSVYDSIMTLPTDIQLLPIKLSLNMRNTRKIHTVVQAHYKGSAISPIGPEGIDVEWISAESPKDVFSKIGERIHHLVYDERVKPSDITILIASRQDISECSPISFLKEIAYRSADDYEKDAVTLDTVRRFKGLDSRVVILAATSNLIGDRESIYVGLSRARTHLIVVGKISSIKI
ncbi:MAG TPA: NERD domain-containing protein [Candidatus Cloacimonadota bacterium]|nr:NERD domain-containing protein [Candidatus Cloacimonadota bacterium]